MDYLSVLGVYDGRPQCRSLMIQFHSEDVCKLKLIIILIIITQWNTLRHIFMGQKMGYYYLSALTIKRRIHLNVIGHVIFFEDMLMAKLY